jgi:hypothetical protein
MILLVWPSGWVRTPFFNPTRPDGQESKPSPRARAPELAQGSGSDGFTCPDPTRNPKTAVQPVGWAPNSGFGHTTSSGWKSERTKIRVRSNPSDKNPNSTNPPGQKECTRPNPSDGGPMSNPAQP